MVVFEPFFAFFGMSAEFAVLCDDSLVSGERVDFHADRIWPVDETNVHHGFPAPRIRRTVYGSVELTSGGNVQTRHHEDTC